MSPLSSEKNPEKLKGNERNKGRKDEEGGVREGSREIKPKEEEDDRERVNNR